MKVVVPLRVGRQAMPPGIVLGEPRGILERGPVKMIDIAAWTQRDSDIVAHFIQVNKQILKSRWFASPPSFTSVGGNVTEAVNPDLESFVFAAVYFRQFTLQKDGLLDDAVERYSRHIGNGVRQFWIFNEANSFRGLLAAPSFPLNAHGSPTLQQLFDAFIYGSSLMHSVPHERKDVGSRFLEIYDTLPRATVLFALNGGMRYAMNYVSKIAAVMYQDFSHWLNEHSLPLPNVRWHEHLFNVPNVRPVPRAQD